MGTNFQYVKKHNGSLHISSDVLKSICHLCCCFHVCLRADDCNSYFCWIPASDIDKLLKSWPSPGYIILYNLQCHLTVESSVIWLQRARVICQPQSSDRPARDNYSVSTILLTVHKGMVLQEINQASINQSKVNWETNYPVISQLGWRKQKSSHKTYWP